jgi:hypothetical protein
MEIEKHLSEEELADLLSGGNPQSNHLEGCKSCQLDVSLLRARLSSMPEAIRSATDLPHFFWQRQRAAIQSRIAVEQASRRSWAGLVWASAASLILIAALLLNGAKSPSRPQAQPDPDQDLLLAVEYAVQSDVPESLAPAALLAEDIRSSVEGSPATSRHEKEKANEN